MRGSDFIFDSVQLMYYKCHKVNFKRGGLYIDSPDWIKKKKTIINLKNEDDKCLQYAASAALNYEEIESHPERVSNIKPLMNKYNQEGIIHPKQMIGKRLRKIIQHLLLIFCMLKKKENFQLVFQNITNL